MTKLKCWKREKSWKGRFEWVKPHKYNVDIERGIVIEKSPKGYDLAVFESDLRRIRKDFKTKPQALKFANKYMKENDKC